MREYKFRAWSEFYNRMFQWDELKEYNLSEILQGDPHTQDLSGNVMQFTGFTDKDNNEIYEGDILGGYPHATALVKWNNEYGCFESASYDYEEGIEVENGALLANDLKNCFDKWIVIGNIYQNKDLLKK